MSDLGSPTSHLGDELSALLDGELPAAAAESARGHLAACPACAAELAWVGQARTWVRGLPAVEPPAGFMETLVAGPAGPGGRAAEEAMIAGPAGPVVVPLRRRRRAVASVAACVAAAGGLLLQAPPDEAPTSPQVGQLVEAHATAGAGGEPLTQLVPVGVPVTFGE